MKDNNNYLKKINLFLVFSFICSGLAFSQTEISNAKELASIANNLSGSYVLTTNITLTESWTPIAGFTGTLDGNGHIISNLNFENTDAQMVGLFSTTTGATIKKLGIENATIIGKKDVAAFIGIMTGGVLEQCYVSNSYIQGDDHIASLVGQTVSDALVQNCYSTAYILAKINNTGGLIGSAKNSKVSKCYFSGYVRGQGSGWQSGGLVGYIENGFTPAVEYSVNLSPLIICNSGGALRIITKTDRSASLINNYSLSSTLLGTSYDLSALDTINKTNAYYGANNYNGANLPNDTVAKSSTFYVESLGWDFTEATGVWKVLKDGYPVLQWQNTPVNSTILNLNAPNDLDILDFASYPLSNIGQINFSKLISSHGLKLDVTCESPKVTISEEMIAEITIDTIISTTEDIDVNITANADFNIINSLATVTLSPSFPGFVKYPEGLMSTMYNAGPGMAIDQNSATTEDSKMIVISNTNLNTFTTYIQSLVNKGFTQVSTTSIDNNVYYTLKNEDQLYYLYYTASKKQVRIIQDNSNRATLTELDTLEQGTGETEFYLYSLDYTHGEGQTSKTDYWKIDCGAMLIMKLKDNSLFIVDAGHERQSSNAALEGLLNFMYEITGQDTGTTLNIRAWFYSHAHGDHVYMTYPFLEKYHNVLNIESVLFNIPSFQIMSGGYDAGTFLMKQAFNTYYPNCKYVKLHTGQKFSLQGVLFDVLFTHEDGVSAAGTNTIGNFNETTTVLAITMDGKKIMLLGDTDGIGQSQMISMYSGATLKSDCVQTTHHGYNNIPLLYKAIGAPLALFCNSSKNAKDNNMSKYLDVINAASNVKTLFADPETYKLTVEDGVIKTEAVPSYRSYFKTVSLPNLTIDKATTSGNKEKLSTVLKKISLADKVIDKSVTGTESVSTDESCSLMLDGNTSTKFCTKTIPATLAWTMKEKVVLKWYVIYAANDNATRPNRNPKEWGLYGSNDGTTWVSIDAVYDPQLPDVNYQGTAFSITKPAWYQYYAMKINSTDGSDVLQFSEIGLYTDDDLPSNIDKTNITDKQSVQVNTNERNQIVVNYSGDVNCKTFATLYNINGQKLVNQQIQNQKAVFKAPVSGIYLVVVSNNKTNIVKKISL
jgi:hypothetical protein